MWPLNADVKHATAWPGISNPVDVMACHSTVHQAQIKQAATSIIAVAPIGDDVAYRAVGPEVTS